MQSSIQMTWKELFKISWMFNLSVNLYYTVCYLSWNIDLLRDLSEILASNDCLKMNNCTLSKKVAIYSEWRLLWVKKEKTKNLFGNKVIRYSKTR